MKRQLPFSADEIRRADEEGWAFEVGAGDKATATCRIRSSIGLDAQSAWRHVLAAAQNGSDLHVKAAAFMIDCHPGAIDDLNHGDAEPTLVRVARAKCIEWHGTQVRKYTGEPYYLHPFEVQETLRRIGRPEEEQVAALLHDVIEDCGVTKEQVSRLFGRRVAALVDMVTDVSRPEHGNREARKLLDLQHLALADAGGQTIKLADLISNSPSIIQHAPGFARKYMQEKRDLLQVLTKGSPILRHLAQGIIDDYFEREGASSAL